MYNEEKEKREARLAGQRALASLQDARNYLRSARNWGIIDLFGGGGLSGLLKHAKVRDASRSSEQAKADLQVFQRELRDVQSIDGLRIEIGDFLTFADFFFDGFVADYLVQSKIRNAQEQVDRAIDMVSNILQSL